MFTKDSLKVWCCFFWQYICIFKILIWDAKDSLLGMFYDVIDLSRSLYMNTPSKDQILSWHVFAGRCWSPLFHYACQHLSCVTCSELGWEYPKNGFSWEQFWSFGFQWSLKMLEAELILLSWDNSGACFSKVAVGGEDEKWITRDMVIS